MLSLFSFLSGAMAVISTYGPAIIAGDVTIVYDENKAIVSKQFEWLEKQTNLRYGLGCQGRDNGCTSNSFDCSGLITASLKYAGVYSGRKKLNSGILFKDYGEVISLKEAKRGDYVYMLNTTGGINHIAIVSGVVNNTIYIYDAYLNYKKLTTRPIPIGKRGGYYTRLFRLDYNKFN